MPTVVISNNTTGADFSGFTTTFHKQNSANTNYSTESTSEVTSYAVGDRVWTHALISGLSNIPSGSTITAVTLEFYVELSIGGAQTIDWHDVLKNVVQSQDTWNNYSSGNAWANGGGFGTGDVNLTAAASASVPDLATGYRSWSGAGLVQWVQDKVDSVSANYGLLGVRNPATAHDTRYVILTSDNGTDGRRPKLTVTYTAGGPVIFDLTTALLNQDASAVQNRLTTVHTAALLNQDATSVQNRQTTVHTAATMVSWVPQAIQMRQIVELGAASWNWLAQEVEFAIGGTPVIFDLLAATFTKTAQSVQNRLTATLTAASQAFAGQSVQNRLTTPLTLGSLSFAAQNVQNRLTAQLTAAQISLTSLAVSARLSVSLTAATMAAWSAKAIQMTQTIVLSSALLKFLTQDITITTDAIVEGFRRGLLRLSRYRKLLKQRRY